MFLINQEISFFSIKILINKIIKSVPENKCEYLTNKIINITYKIYHL
jgi:hypothetical protein